MPTTGELSLWQPLCWRSSAWRPPLHLATPALDDPGGGKATAVPSRPPGQGVQVLGEADWIVLIKGSPATFFELLADTQTAVDLMIRGFAS